MAGKAFAANELLSANNINLYLATTYEYAYNGTSTFIGAPVNAWNTYGGSLTVDIEVNGTGILLVEWGFEGWAAKNTLTPTASVWVTPNLTGANTVGPTVETACRVNSAGVAGPRSTSREIIFTGLTPGVTTVTLLGRVSDLTNGTTSPTRPVDENFVDNQWLYVQNYR